jgi:hypothetical protein
MLFKSFKWLTALAVSAWVLTGCGGAGGSSAPAPTNVTVSTTDSTATISWNQASGVEYWLFVVPTVLAPADTSAMNKWVGLLGGKTLVSVNSPLVITGLVNGTSYSYSINGRTNGGPGGPGSTPVLATTQTAGANWAAGNTPSLTPADLRTVINGGNGYVAAGAGGALFTSTDGASWTTGSSGVSTGINGSIYFGKYNLVGDGGLVLQSTDGVAWARQTSGVTQRLNGIITNGTSLMVAVGDAGTIITSADGVTWTKATSVGTTRNLLGVGYSSFNTNTWIAVGEGGTMLTSSDALTWTPVTSGTTQDLKDVFYTAFTTNTFVAVGNGGTLLTSIDGVTWAKQALATTRNLNSIVYSTQFAAVGDGGVIYTSIDGATWTQVSQAATNQNLLGIAAGSLSFTAVGAAGANIYSR